VFLVRQRPIWTPEKAEKLSFLLNWMFKIIGLPECLLCA